MVVFFGFILQCGKSLKAVKTLGILTLALVCHLCLAAGRSRSRTYASTGCEFPSRWTGIWFQKGVHPLIKIEKDVFSFKGKCLASDGSSMFFIEERNREKTEKCFRCVVIYEKHPNVLQYRETFCFNYKSLEQACANLNADANLYSLFRVDAEPVSCQLKGPFTFSYSRGGKKECKYPVSTVDTCTEDSRLLFRFQACADVMGTESSVEELSCLAEWKEGSYQYLVGKMTNKKHHNHLFQDDNAYRCFVFDQQPSEKGEIQMSQSGDASCDGLASPFEGSRTMKLLKSEHPKSRCQFPSWVTTHHRWHTLDGKKTFFFFSHQNTSFRLIHHHQEHLNTEFSCAEEVHLSSNFSTIIAYGMSGCENGHVCMKFYKRNDHIIEIQMGSFARSSHEACHLTLLDMFSQEYVTLLASAAPSLVCPPLLHSNGLGVQMSKSVAFLAEACRDNMVVGCRSHDKIDFLSTCPSAAADIKSFHCHGHWEEEGRSYLVTGLRNTRSKYCFVYWNKDQTTHLSGIHDTCRRTVEPGITRNVTMNISSAGHCESLLGSNPSTRTEPWALTLAITFSISIFIR